MPRPRVLPSQRQRALEACSSCRDSKKRCSGTAPCTHCVRRGVGDSCVVSRRSRGVRSLSKASNRNTGERLVLDGEHENLPVRDSAVLPSLFGSESQNRNPGQDNAHRVALSTEPQLNGNNARESSLLDETLELPRSNGSNTPLGSAKPRSRMLLNLRGERVYIGDGASLSFLQLIRKIVTDQIGPSQFSPNAKSDTMLEKESPRSHPHGSHMGELSIETKLQCAKRFHAVTGGLIEVFVPGELESLLGRNQGADTSTRVLVDLVVAIGLQCDFSTDTHDLELELFREVQSKAFSGMLEDPDIDMIRVFLLMAFYLLGECRRNTAFMYLGVAARAAAALGLHSRDTYTDFHDPKQQLRLRVWLSLRVLDIVVNSLLGRPSATAGVHSDLGTTINETLVSSTDRGFICLVASYNLVHLIDRIVGTLYDKKEITIPNVEGLLQELGAWSQSLPDFLKTSPSTASSPAMPPEKDVIGRVHVSCLYYFAVMLVTRPILISTLTQQSTSGLVHARLASACLDAAKFVVQTCSGAQELNIFQANMCILKAIIFPAGLVVGFQIFAKGSVDYTIETAFHGARDLLKILGAKSPQAALYFDILTSLSAAINERRRRSVPESRNSYVSKIFNFKKPTMDTSATDVTVGGPQNEPLLEEQRLGIDDLFQSWSLGQNTPTGQGEVFLDWDSLDISQWDTFPYLT